MSKKFEKLHIDFGKRWEAARTRPGALVYCVPGQIQGIEFIEMVRGRWPYISAILTSGYLIDPATVPASTIYLHKPWSLDDLVIAVASLLQPDHPISKI
nr:hypothetical protein [Pseudomonas fluorescens]